MKLFTIPLLSVVIGISGFSQDRCTNPSRQEYTNDYLFSAGSARAASGDVVGIDLSLRVEEGHGTLFGMGVIACYDKNVAELIVPPLYAEEFEGVTFIRLFLPTGDGTFVQREDGGLGFSLVASFVTEIEDLEEVLLAGGSLPIGTVFFRLKGQPGDLFELRFCNTEFVDPAGACHSSILEYDDQTALSNRHRSGTIEIVEGEPTHPTPEIPPIARVYPEEPTQKSAGILFESTAEVARPGGRATVDLFVTSQLDFNGFEVSLRFPSEYLTLQVVEEHTRQGLKVVDNAAGQFALVMMGFHRRIGAERERVHLATLEFDVGENASEVQALNFQFENYVGRDESVFRNHLSIRFRNRTGLVVPLEAVVEPLVVTSDVLMIQSEPTIPGDVNLDYDVTLTDAIALLGALFRGERSIVCPAAADFDEDERVNITDAVGILLHLFGSRPRILETTVFCSSSS